MSESDLDDALKDLDLDGVGDEPGGADDDPGEAEAGDGDKMELDPELAAELGGASGGEGADLAAELAAAMGDDSSGADSGDSMQLDPDLEAALAGDSAGGGGEAAADAPAAPAEKKSVAVTAESIAANLPGIDKDSTNLEFLLETKLHVTFEVGRSKMLVTDLLTLGQGSVVELHRLVGDELDFLVNGKLVAKGEVVVVNEKFGCRITHIIPPEDRIKYLSGY